MINNVDTKFLYDWLKNIDLTCYFNLFIQKGIFTFEKLISNMKKGKFKITKEDLMEIGIFIPGHIYRIITKLGIDSELINKNISEYLFKKRPINISNGKEIIINNYLSDLCCGCCNLNLKNFDKNNKIFNYINKEKIFILDYWLKKINLFHLKQNFEDNGFDKIEYFIMQMFSSVPINDEILEKELKVENEKERDYIIIQLNKDVKYIIRHSNKKKIYKNDEETPNIIEEKEEGNEKKDDECKIF